MCRGSVECACCTGHLPSTQVVAVACSATGARMCTCRWKPTCVAAIYSMATGVRECTTGVRLTHCSKLPAMVDAEFSRSATCVPMYTRMLECASLGYIPGQMSATWCLLIGDAIATTLWLFPAMLRAFCTFCSYVCICTLTSKNLVFAKNSTRVSTCHLTGLLLSINSMSYESARKIISSITKHCLGGDL